MKTDYHPISCDYHDFLLAKATLQEICHIEYISEDLQITEIESIIYDIFTKNSEEFMILENNLTIRLDKIRSVNGQDLSDFSCQLH